MRKMKPVVVRLAWFSPLFVTPGVASGADGSDGCDEMVSAELRVDTGNPWRPPFGLDRVGAPPVVHVKLEAERELRRDYFVVSYRKGNEEERQPVTLAKNPTGGVWTDVSAERSLHYGHVRLGTPPEEVALIARCPSDEQVVEVARQWADWPSIEADATARADHPINPVDLNAILVPHDTLLLAGGQGAKVEIAALSRSTNRPDARLKVWFEGEAPVETRLNLTENRRIVKELDLAPVSASDRTVLHLALVDGGHELWRKDISTMIVASPPPVPGFGAVETKLRVEGSDSAIALEGTDLNNSKKHDPTLNDVVVFLPNGSRFVFWRSFHYAPFWAGLRNTGLNYEWAENLTHPFEAPGWGTLFPEPLFDFELRFSRVRIIESTPSRIHVRWSYEGTDLQYRRWGEQIREDFYFYPDGFGTRVMTLSSEPDADYEVSEFIVLTPPGAYPLEVLPQRGIEMLYVDGIKRDINFPVLDETWKRYGNTHFVMPDLRNVPAIYRIYQEKNDPVPAIFFSPRHTPERAFVYQPSYREAEIATAALGGWDADSPGFTCLWTVINDLPEPVSTSTFPMLDALGQSREMMIRRWAWLIAKTNVSDGDLLKWAKSFSEPPSIEVTGADVDLPSYSPERRAIRLVARASEIKVRLKPSSHTVNPVFEMAGAPGEIEQVLFDGQPLSRDRYAWDGRTLWLDASIDASGADLTLHFRQPGSQLR